MVRIHILHIIKATIFILLLLLVFYLIEDVLGISDDTHSKTEFDIFYDLEADSLDAVWLGASAVQSTCIPSEAYAHSGIRMYSLATSSQPVALTKYLLEEAEKTQSPALYLIDIRMLAYDYDIMGNEIFCDNYIRRVTDSMHLSKTRISAVEDMLCRLGLPTDFCSTSMDYYLGFLMYHSRWKDVDSSDFGINSDCFMGYYMFENTQVFDKEETLSRRDADPIPVSADNQKYLMELLDYLDDFEGEVLFTNTPNNQDEVRFANYNYIKDIITSAGYEVLDLNDYADEIGLDYSTDFSDSMHVNYRGAMKITDFMADYLVEHYDLEARECEAGIISRLRGTDQIYEETQERLLTRIAEMEEADGAYSY